MKQIQIIVTGIGIILILFSSEFVNAKLISPKEKPSNFNYQSKEEKTIQTKVKEKKIEISTKNQKLNIEEKKTKETILEKKNK